MSERIWNEEQLCAIESIGGDLLVSAAAGSGKTAVLVERVIRLMTDEKAPVDADRFLIVTFTNAAAAEMKLRISKALAELSAKNPEDARLARQLLLMENARICTIDSFCLDTVRENFSAAGVAPDFRIADEFELNLISGEAAEEAAEKFYGENSEAFSSLLETLAGGKSDGGLFENVGKLYNFLRSLPHYGDWLAEKLEDYRDEKPVSETVWGKAIFEHAKYILEHAIKSERNVTELCQKDEIAVKYAPVLGSDVLCLENLLEHMESGWDSLRELVFLAEFEKLPGIRGYDSPLKALVKSTRDMRKKSLEKLRSMLGATEAEFSEDMRELYPMVKCLFELTLEYDRLFSEKKRDKSVVDFSDLEHFTLALLSEKDGDGKYIPTRAAKDISERFDYILVDECQDINNVQDMIFKAVSNGKNLFYVGDVKQSIYRFRQAMPELFIEKRSRWPLFDGENYPAAIILGKNYRSRKNIADAVNFIFKRIMSTEAAEMDYTAEEMLVPAAQFPESDQIRNEFMLVDSGGEDSDSAEAAAVAERISAMLKNRETVSEGGALRPIRCSDVCILLRSIKNRDAKYVSALRKKGIACRSERGEGFLELPEIAAVIDVLKAADNPLLDIPVAGAMLSEMFLFSPDELAKIRAEARDVPLYSAVLKAAEGGDKKSAAFIETLGGLRRAAACETADSVIQRLYSLTSYPQIMRACSGGEIKLANLRRLIKYAAERETAGWHGTSGFLRFISRLGEQGGDLKPAGYSGNGEDCVKIMTVHHSKGLEFPVVFLCGTGKRFKFDNERTKVHQALGFACSRRDKTTGILFETVPSEAVKIELVRQSIAEEIRVLYVALTRAKENLVISCCSKNPESLLVKAAAGIDTKDSADPFYISSATTEAHILLPPLLCHPDAALFRSLAGISEASAAEDESRWSFSVIRPETEEAEEESEAEAVKAEPDEGLAETLRQRQNWKYPFAAAEKIPVKAGVSELTHKEIREKLLFTATLQKGALSGAERGTALHTFMQFCDFALAEKEPAAEILRTAEKGFITKKQADVIDPKKAETFFKSSLYSAIKSADTVYRELRFLQPIPALELGYENTAPEDKVTVQGVADCVFVKDRKFTVVDYKTDLVDDLGELSLRYSEQLLMYKKLLEKSLGLPCSGCVIWSFCFGKELWL